MSYEPNTNSTRFKFVHYERFQYYVALLVSKLNAIAFIDMSNFMKLHAPVKEWMSLKKMNIIRFVPKSVQNEESFI